MLKSLGKSEKAIIWRQIRRELWAWRQNRDAISVEDFEQPVPGDQSGMRLSLAEKRRVARSLLRAGAYELAMTWFRGVILRSLDTEDAVLAARSCLDATLERQQALAGDPSVQLAFKEARDWAHHALEILLAGKAGRNKNPFDLGHVMSALELAKVFRMLEEPDEEGRVRAFLAEQLPTWVQNWDVGLMAMPIAVELGYEAETALILSGLGRIIIDRGTDKMHHWLFQSLVSNRKTELVWSILGRAHGAGDLSEMRRRARIAAISLRDYKLAMQLVDDPNQVDYQPLLASFVEPMVRHELADDWHLVIDGSTNPTIAAPTASSAAQSIAFLAQLIPHATEVERKKMYLRGKSLYKQASKEASGPKASDLDHHFLVLAAWAAEKGIVTKMLRSTGLTQETVHSLLSAAIRRGHGELFQSIQATFPEICSPLILACERKHSGLPHDLEKVTQDILLEIPSSQLEAVLRPILNLLKNQYKETNLVKALLWRAIERFGSEAISKRMLQSVVADTGDLTLWDAISSKIKEHTDVIEIGYGFWACLRSRMR